MQEATDIYYWDYWIKSNVDLIDDGILCKVMFAAMVNMGISRAVKLLQKACNVFGAGIKEDGVIGDRTADWINKFTHHTALMAATKYYLAGFYISLKKPKYIAGWLKRLEI
jgi:lysozyme family protein